MNIKRVAPFFLSMFIVLSLFAPLTAFAQKQGQKVVRVGWYESQFNSRGENGSRSGYAYEYQQKIAAYTGWKYEYVEGTWVDLLQKMIDGKIDLMTDVSYTKERARKMLYPEFPMGTENYYLFVAGGDATVSPEDVSTLNGKTIGVNKGSYQEMLLKEWVQAKKIRVEIVEQENDLDSWQMIRNGELDGYVSLDSFDGFGEIVPVFKIGSSDFYFTLNSERGDLLNELNAALTKIHDEDRGYNQKLWDKYVTSQGQGAHHYLTSSEVDWLSKHGTIRVGYRDNFMPLSGTDSETGKATGLIKDYLETASRLFKNADISFELVSYPSTQAAKEALKKGEIDCVFPLIMSLSDAEEERILMANPVVETKMEMVVSRNNYKNIDLGGNIRIAVNEGNVSYAKMIKNYFPNCEVIYFADTESCLKGISDGKADGIVVSSHRLSTISKLMEQYYLSSIGTEVTSQCCFAINAGDVYLYSILNKIEKLIPNSSVQGMIIDNTRIDISISFEDYLKANLLQVLLSCIVIAAVLVFLLIRSRKAEKTAKLAEKRTAEANHEIKDINAQLEERQAQLEEATAEQEAQLEEIQKLYTQKEYLSYSCKMVYPEVYIVNLKDNTYCELDTDGFSITESGDYLAAIDEHINTGRIDKAEEERIRHFLSPKNIYHGLSENQSIEMRYRRTLRDGRTQWCLTTFVACEMEDEHPSVALMLIQNIDEVIAEEEHQKAILEENQERLAEAVENARNANKAKSDFLSRMSHDIRTPMNVIVGMTEIAKRHFEDPAKVADCLDKINMESVHLQTLINDVLDISAIESGKLTIKPEDIRLKDIVDNMDVSVRSLVISKSIDYQYKQGNIFFPYIKADSLRISQIYLNLLSNAVKYTPAGGKVMFELWQEMDENPGRVKLHAKISDTGMGMSEEFMQDMYSEFSRAVDTRVNKIQGTGLGLAIVKQLVDLMDGTITVQSKLGEGTCFEVTLIFDYVEKTDAMLEKDNQQEDFSPLKGLKVLIAEDNDLNYEIAYELLSDYDFVISRAVDGAVAFEMMDSAAPGTYDLILMDMQMPVMDGLEATKAIREINREDAKTIPIIAMTANAYVEDALACRQAGMNDHVAKPINVGLLMKVIMEHMKSTLDMREKRQKADEEIRSVDAIVRNYSVLRNSKVARNLPGGFFAYSAHGDERLIYANDKACEIWGCKDFQELLSYTRGSFRGMVHPGDIEKTETSIWEQINSGSNDMDSVKYRIIRKDGEIRWLDDYGQLVRDEVNGDVFYVFVSDATSNNS